MSAVLVGKYPREIKRATMAAQLHTRVKAIQTNPAFRQRHSGYTKMGLSRKSFMSSSKYHAEGMQGST